MFLDLNQMHEQNDRNVQVCLNGFIGTQAMPATIYSIT